MKTIEISKKEIKELLKVLQQLQQDCLNNFEDIKIKLEVTHCKEADSIVLYGLIQKSDIRTTFSFSNKEYFNEETIEDFLSRVNDILGTKLETTLQSTFYSKLKIFLKWS